MSYATAADMRARFGPREMEQLLDTDGDALADEGRLAAVLCDAASEIDAVLADAYALPLGVACPLLTGLSCDLARSRLYDDEVPEAVSRRAAKARRILRQLREGSMDLVDDTGALVERRSHPPGHAAPTGPVAQSFGDRGSPSRRLR